MISSTNLLARAALPRHEAVRLLAAAAGVSRTRVLAGVALDADAVGRYVAMVERRQAGVPLQHLEGSVPFGPIELAVDGRALIPRPETEYLWSLLVDQLEAPGVIVDVGTGTGALALALQSSFPDATVFATELSPEAAGLARENAATTGLAVTVLEGDLYDPLPSGLVADLIVANPPYIAEGEWAALPADVRDHDPRMALIGGPEGTEVIERLVAGALPRLAPGGLLAVEIGETQGGVVLAMAQRAGLAARIVADLAGRDRYLWAERPGG